MDFNDYETRKRISYERKEYQHATEMCPPANHYFSKSNEAEPSSDIDKTGRAWGSAHFIEDDVSQLLSPRGVVRGGRQQQDLQAGGDCHQDPGL